MSLIHQQVTESSVRYLEEGVRRIRKCADQISEEDFWRDPNENLVSIGNLTLHLSGNIRQYLIAGLGKKPFVRNRDGEFQDKPNLKKDQAIGRLAETVAEASEVLEQLKPEVLEAVHTIQGYDLTGTDAIIHVVEHLMYHVGQITFAVKNLKNVDVGYYAGSDLNKQND